MSRRFAAYAVCIERDTILLVLDVLSSGEEVWSLPGGGVEQCEDPFNAVTREVVEETGCEAVVSVLLGVDSRTISAAESYSGLEHQNIGIFYAVELIDGEPRSQPNDDVIECSWVPFSKVGELQRSSVVDVGLALARQRPATGHVAPVPVGGLILH